MWKKVIFLFFAPIIAIAGNPICDNYDKYQITIYNCLAFNDSQFVSAFMRWPTFSDGTPFETEGDILWNDKAVRISKNSRQYKKNGIVFKVYTMAATYGCDYVVFDAQKATVGDLDLGGYAYGVNFYNCGFNNEIELDIPDTTFAETELQRSVSGMDLVNAMITGNMEEVAPWRIYRTDGTLKFIGDISDGYCMSRNGMKKTKKVTSAIYCK